MGRTTIFSRGWWAVGILLATGLARSAGAVYLDEDQHVSLRLRAYTQAAIRAEGSYGDTTPSVKVGQLIQHRNFFNPELEAKLASYASWLGPLAPDALDFRLAGRAFYDGIYDYGTGQFSDQLKRVQARFAAVTNDQQLIDGTDDEINPRDVYGNQRRVNELYLSYTKGPFFMRVGRQAISWGESDTIAILDQNNPFDLTLAVPGIFEDLDEARIPLWTIRSSYSVFDTLGPFSSGFVEAYWVPGDIDTTTATVPLQTVSPYSNPGVDPANQVAALATFIPRNKPLKTIIADHVPAPGMESSRYGVRAQTVVARKYTVSAWYYVTYPNAPVPRLVGLTDTGRERKFAIELVHGLTPVVGVSNTFFVDPLDGIVRMEAEYFNREPSFIPEFNLRIPQLVNSPSFLLQGCRDPRNPSRKVACVGQFPALGDAGLVPRASYLRWELGFDRFFFFRPLNPSNSFVWITAIVGSYNLDETSRKDFRFNGLQKPRTAGTKASDFVQLQKVDNNFAQTHLQTDYLHGRLTPSVTVIVNRLGAFAVPVQVSYRFTDSLLFDVYYTAIGGAFTGPGFFRDRDQLAVRATVQLN